MKTKNKKEGGTLENFNNQEADQPVIHSTRKMNSEMEMTQKTVGGLQFDFSNNPLSEIEKCTGIIINQEPASFELISGCERNIVYHIIGETSQGNKYLFRCEEDTGCLMRWLCPTGLRKLDMNILHVVSPENPLSIKKFGNSLKPFACPCFCLCRPEIFLTLDESEQKIGSIKEPFSCGDTLYEIFDDKNEIKYLVKAKCCQCGLLFSNSILGRTGEVVFNIIDPQTKEEIGNISKKNPLMSNELKREVYKITFPNNSAVNDKLLLTALGLMIDYQYFEKDPSKF